MIKQTFQVKDIHLYHSQPRQLNLESRHEDLTGYYYFVYILCFDAQQSGPHSYDHALVYTVLIVSAILIMVVSGAKAKSLIRFFNISNDAMSRTYPDVGKIAAKITNWKIVMG